jgi:hypothetical protein
VINTKREVIPFIFITVICALIIAVCYGVFGCAQLERDKHSSTVADAPVSVMADAPEVAIDAPLVSVLDAAGPQDAPAQHACDASPSCHCDDNCPCDQVCDHEVCVPEVPQGWCDSSGCHRR